MEPKLRSPICTVMGHVDHGKSTLLDYIRGTTIVNSEPGAITQAIGASIVPLETIMKICGNLLNTKYPLKLKIPGLLFIDTPGHEAFTNLRKRGGSLSDLSILVIDILEGPKQQTLEALNILKKDKTPFVVAANKIDRIEGFKEFSDDLIDNINRQSYATQELIEKKIYEIVGWLNENNLNAERFDRVTDFTKEIAVVPISSKTGHGVPELLIILMALAQKYLTNNLLLNETQARGTILEVKRVKGDLIAADVILYDGSLKVGDEIVFGALEGPKTTTVRGLFMPAPLNEMRDEKAEFIPVKEVSAAIGVRVIAKDLEFAVAGMPIATFQNDEQKSIVEKEINQILSDFFVDSSNEGVVVKVDSLGSLDALLYILKKENIPIKKASVGMISKRDIIDASSNDKPENKIIIAFNVSMPKELEKDVKDANITVIEDRIIYHLIDRLLELQKEIKEREEMRILQELSSPFKIKVLKGYIFRQSNPAIFGVQVLGGKVKPGRVVMRDDGKVIGVIKGIQKEKQSVAEALRNESVAISLTNAIAGRHFFEEDILYSDISENNFKKLKDFKKYLTEDEIEILREIAEIKRKENPMWGI
ncbi:MAG: translation initiation factor IF-2 [Candidatus Woesearchaeota archaeon]